MSDDDSNLAPPDDTPLPDADGDGANGDDLLDLPAPAPARATDSPEGEDLGVQRPDPCDAIGGEQ